MTSRTIPTDEATKRAAKESSHRVNRRRSFVIEPTHLSPNLPTPDLTLEKCHSFCNRACAIYSPVYANERTRREIMDAAFAEMATKRDISEYDRGTFLIKFIHCYDDDDDSSNAAATTESTAPPLEESVQSLLVIHKSLCEHVDRRCQGVLCEEDLDANPRDQKKHSRFRLLPSFRDNFIVVDGERYMEHDVLLVQRVTENDSEKYTTSKMSFEEALGHVAAWQQ